VGLALGHGPTLVPVDDDGRARRPAIIWGDTRSTREADELAAATGFTGWSLAGLPAALWLERHEPETARDVCWWLSTWDWLALRLSGEARTSLVEGQPFPSAAVLEPLGLDASRIAPGIGAGEIVGALEAAPAVMLGLRAGIPVVAGIVDAWASYHGAGMTRAGDAMDPGGSAGGFGVYADRPLVVPGSFSTIATEPGRY
jgi:sugar (pentulose or hexulose) kinase